MAKYHHYAELFLTTHIPEMAKGNEPIEGIYVEEFDKDEDEKIRVGEK